MSAGSVEGFLEKRTKITKGWMKRFVRFNHESCKLEYGESESKIKTTLATYEVVRCSEVNPKVVAGSPDLYSFIAKGTTMDGKPEAYQLRCPDKDSLNQWYFAIRHSLAAAGKMDPFHCGLGDTDPRTNLAFVTVPVEHLYRFHLLDRGIVYLFEEVNVRSSTGGEDSTKELLVIGDRYMYLFQASAEVHRCVPIVSLRKVYSAPGTVGLQIAEPQHDIMLVDCLSVQFITHVLDHVLRAIPNTQEIEADTSCETAADVAAKLHLTQRDNYALKVIGPTQKLKLHAAMENYERETGQPFVYGSAAKPAAKLPKNHQHQAPSEMNMDDPMAVLLLKLGLQQYVVLLQRQHLDLDVLSCMDADDLIPLGIESGIHRERIAAAARGEDPPPATTTTPAAPSAGATAPSPPNRPAAITLTDSDEDEGLPPPITNSSKTGGGAGGRAPPTITLSSDDEDEGLPIMKPTPAAGGAPMVTLTDSDEEGLPPPNPSAGAKPPIILDDDDI